MLLVDTTVWIDFFANRETFHTSFLEMAISKQETICTCGPVLTEILQGIRNPQEYKLILMAFKPLIFLAMQQETYIQSANIYRSLRQHGITIRKTIDCMIAATALEHGAVLLHNDKDFEQIEKYTKLKTIKKAS